MCCVFYFLSPLLIEDGSFFPFRSFQRTRATCNFNSKQRGIIWKSIYFNQLYQNNFVNVQNNQEIGLNNVKTKKFIKFLSFLKWNFYWKDCQDQWLLDMGNREISQWSKSRWMVQFETALWFGWISEWFLIENGRLCHIKTIKSKKW